MNETNTPSDDTATSKQSLGGCGSAIMLLYVSPFLILAYIGFLFWQGPKQADEPAPSNVTVSQAELGEAWPFTVSEGEVTCENGALFFVHEGKAWALNGSAAAQEGVGDLKESGFWANDPEMPAEMKMKKSIAPIEERARDAC